MNLPSCSSAWVVLLAAACNAQSLDDGGPRDDGRDAAAPRDSVGAGDAGPTTQVVGFSFGGGQGPHFEQVDEDYEAILDATIDFAEFFCVCQVSDAKGAEFKECVDSYLTNLPPPVLYCSKEIYSQSDAASAALRCQREIVDDYMACVLQSTCLDFDNISECEIDRIIQDLECEDIPYEVWAKEQEQCLGRDLGEPWECTNGELINPTWVCDFEEDCQDGSDEAGCDPHAGLMPAP